MKCRHYGHHPGEGPVYTFRMALRIKQLRTEHGWTQDELAQRSRMSRSQLALGVTTDELFVHSAEQTAFFDLVKRLSDDDRAILVRMAEALAAKSEATE